MFAPFFNRQQQQQLDCCYLLMLSCCCCCCQLVPGHILVRNFVFFDNLLQLPNRRRRFVLLLLFLFQFRFALKTSKIKLFFFCFYCQIHIYIGAISFSELQLFFFTCNLCSSVFDIVFFFSIFLSIFTFKLHSSHAQKNETKVPTQFVIISKADRTRKKKKNETFKL